MKNHLTVILSSNKAHTSRFPSLFFQIPPLQSKQGSQETKGLPDCNCLNMSVQDQKWIRVRETEVKSDTLRSQDFCLGGD